MNRKDETEGGNSEVNRKRDTPLVKKQRLDSLYKSYHSLYVVAIS